MNKIVLTLLSLLLIAGMLTGCAPAAEEPAAAEPEAPAAEEEVAAEPEAPKPTSVTVAINFPPGGFDPIGMGNLTNSPFINPQIFCSLYGRDENASVVNKLAASEEITADGSAVIIKVRDDVKFHNGDPVTVDDIVFSYNTYLTSPSGQIMLNYVGAEMTKIDDETVSVPLMYPNVDYKGIIHYAYIVPKVLYESDPVAFNTNPVSCGAYEFVSFTNNEMIELKAFSDYFEGAAPIETIFAKVISDPSTAAIALESGEIDVLFSVPALELERLTENEDLAVFKRPSNGMLSLGLMKGETMDNIKVRQAIFHGVNPEDALIAARNGDGVLPTDLTPEDNIGSLAGMVDYSNTYDPELAKQLLEESGFDLATPITFTLCPTYFGADASASGISVVNNLQELGLNIVVENLDGNVCTEKWISGGVEMMINKQGVAPMLITDTLNWYTSTGDFFGMNNATAKSSELDEAVNAMRFALTEEAYKAAGETALKLFYDTYQILPLYSPNENVVYNAQVKNVVTDAGGYGMVSAFYWTY